MRITQEADYAIRITYYLSQVKYKTGAKDISEKTGVTLRFALKILRKLIMADIAVSFKGVKGGYMLKKSLGEISIGEIIEIIDGPIAINHCLNNEFDCTRVQDKKDCNFHKVFQTINSKIRSDLYAVTMDKVMKMDESGY